MDRYVRDDKIDLDLLNIAERANLFRDLLRFADEYQREVIELPADPEALAEDILGAATFEIWVDNETRQVMHRHLLGYLLDANP